MYLVVCFVLVQGHERHKLSSKAIKCVFLEYNDIQKGIYVMIQHVVLMNLTTCYLL